MMAEERKTPYAAEAASPGQADVFHDQAHGHEV
jgi:hypothetical protein